MIVILEEELFSAPHDALRLVNLFHLGYTGRHRIQTDPLYDPATDSTVRRWLEARDPAIRDEIVLALELGVEEATHGIPSDRTVRVAPATAPDWEAEPPVLPLPVAESLLRRPLRLVLENHRNDRAFLETVALKPWRNELRKAFADDLVEPVHGGGLPEMKARVEDLAALPSERLLHWFLFDSDAREPDRPSADSEALREACDTHAVQYHQLRRRASENYLPPKALFAWAYRVSRGQHRSRREKAEAFAKMEPVQRHHFNMKKGFRGDQARGIPDLFGTWPLEPELLEGFGQQIGNLYLDPTFQFRDDWLVRDGQTEETKRLVQAIFRAL